MSLRTISSIAFVTLSAPAVQALGPYVADANTTFLYHFDEAAETSVASNEGIAGYNAITYDGLWAGDETDQMTIDTVLGATGSAGFGNAATLTQTTGIGVDLDGDGGFRANDADPISPDRFEDHTEILGTSFTLEGMVNVSAITGVAQQQIISTDSFITGAAGGNALRGFQFRFFEGVLDFIFIGSGVVEHVGFSIPTEGVHAFEAGEWFHAAVSFDGSDLRFYWTRVDASPASANLIGTVADTIDLTDPATLVLGNEGRSAANPPIDSVLSNEGLQGLLDEVRISNVARSADEFIFAQSPGLPNPAMTGISRAPDGSAVTLTWRSRPGASYILEFSTDLANWQEVNDSVGSEGVTTTLVESLFAEQFQTNGAYRVREN